MFDKKLTDLSTQVLAAARAKKWTIATAESCTGGLVAVLLTEIPGSSDVFDRGFITYANAAKEQILDVSPHTLKTHGAVSEETVAEMAEGALDSTDADLAIAVTGIAGPGGGSAQKPVGLVYIAVATSEGNGTIVKNNFSGDRSSIRQQAVQKALEMALAAIGDQE